MTHGPPSVDSATTRDLAVELAALIGENSVSPLLDARQAAAVLNTPQSWVLAEARAGRIPHVRLGRYVRFDRDDLLAWVQRKKTRSREP